MHTALSAAINNDTLSELLLALILWLSLLRVQDRVASRRYILLGGLLFGLALLTKITAYVGLALFLAAEVGRWALEPRPARATLHFWPRSWHLSPLAGPASLVVLGVVLSAWWFVRNAATYGNLDILGRQRHDLVVVGQPRTVLGWDAVQHFVVVSFRSFWGQFGWMGILVDERIYQGLAVFTALAAVGMVIFVFKTLPVASSTARAPVAEVSIAGLSPAQKWGLGLAILLFLLILAGMVQYNLDFIQPQGRYLFPATVSIALCFVLGLRALLRQARLSTILLALGVAWLVLQGAGRAFLVVGGGLVLLFVGLRRWRPRVMEAAFLAVVLAALAVVDVYCLYGVIIPYFRQ